MPHGRMATCRQCGAEITQLTGMTGLVWATVIALDAWCLADGQVRRHLPY